MTAAATSDLPTESAIVLRLVVGSGLRGGGDVTNWNQYARLQYRGRQRANGSYVDRRKRLDQRTVADSRSFNYGGWSNQEIADKDVLWDDPYALVEPVSVSTIREARRIYPSGSAYISPEDKLLAAVVGSPLRRQRRRSALRESVDQLSKQA